MKKNLMLLLGVCCALLGPLSAITWSPPKLVYSTSTNIGSNPNSYSFGTSPSGNFAILTWQDVSTLQVYVSIFSSQTIAWTTTPLFVGAGGGALQSAAITDSGSATVAYLFNGGATLAMYVTADQVTWANQTNSITPGIFENIASAIGGSGASTSAFTLYTDSNGVSALVYAAGVFNTDSGIDPTSGSYFFADTMGLLNDAGDGYAAWLRFTLGGGVTTKLVSIPFNAGNFVGVPTVVDTGVSTPSPNSAFGLNLASATPSSFVPLVEPGTTLIGFPPLQAASPLVTLDPGVVRQNSFMGSNQLGTVIAAWFSPTNSNFLYGATFSGGVWNPPYVIDPEATGSAPILPDVTVNAQGDAIVVWETGTEVLSSFFNGSSWEKVTVAPLGFTPAFATPGVMYLPGGNAAIAFWQNDSNFFEWSIEGTVVFPPTSLTGKQVLNRFLAQKSYVTILNWMPGTNSSSVVGYRIYKDGVFIAQVGSNVFTFENIANNCSQNTPHTYEVTAVNSAGVESPPIIITLG